MFGDSPETCWSEVSYHNQAANRADYQLYQVEFVNGTFVDVGAVEGTQFLQAKANGGYEPTHELSNRFVGTHTLGFRYVSYPAHAHGGGGTCFCVYQSVMSINQDEFQPIGW